MKEYSEEQAYKAAGSAFLEPDEVAEAAQDMVHRNQKVIAYAIIDGNFSRLSQMLKREEKYSRERKALEAWKRATGAIWDSNRQKFIVIA